MGLQWKVKDWLYVIAEVLVGIFSLLGNALVLLAIKRYRLLRTPTNCFIGSLAAADALVGLVIPPTTILSYRGWPEDFYGCVFLNSLVVLITNISILNLVAVTLDRFIAVKSPFFYRRVISANRALVVVIFTWIVATVTGLIPLMGWNLDDKNFTQCSFASVIDLKFVVYLNFFGVFTPLFFAMLFVYLYLFYIIYQQQRWERTQRSGLGTRTKEMRRQANQRKRDVRGAKGLAYVIILFAACWLPLHIMNTLFVFTPEKVPRVEVLLMAIVLSHANSVFNPFLYAFSSSRFKKAMKKILCCKKGGLTHTSFDETHFSQANASRLRVGLDAVKEEGPSQTNTLQLSDTGSSTLSIPRQLGVPDTESSTLSIPRQLGVSSLSLKWSTPLITETEPHTEIARADRISTVIDQEGPVVGSNNTDNGQPVARIDNSRRKWSGSVWMTPSSQDTTLDPSVCSVDRQAVTGDILPIYNHPELDAVGESSVDKVETAVVESVKDSKTTPEIENKANLVKPTASPRDHPELVSVMRKRFSSLLTQVPGHLIKRLDSHKPEHDTKISDSQKPEHDTKISDSHKPEHDTKISDSHKPEHDTKISDSHRPEHDTKISDSHKPEHDTKISDSHRPEHDTKKLDSQKSEHDTKKSDSQKPDHGTKKSDSQKSEHDTKKSDSQKSERGTKKSDRQKSEHDTKKSDRQKSERGTKKSDSQKSKHDTKESDSQKLGHDTKS